MSKTKLKDKIKKKISNLFNDNLSEVESLVGFDESSIIQTKSEYTEDESSGKFFTFLRQALLFAPGAILLWVNSWGITESLITNSSIPLWAYPVFIISFLMTTFGLSDGRNPKNFLISISSVLFGILLGVISGFFTEFLRLFVIFVGDEIFLSLSAFIWLIPLFTKLWLDSREND